MSEWKMEINYCRTQSEANDNKMINPTHFADVYVCACVCVPWVALRSSWPSYSVRCLQGPQGWSCWWCCVHAPLPPPAQTGQIRRERERKKKKADSSSTFFHVRVQEKRIGKTPYLCLGHDESEYRVRSGALVIHSCSGCGTLLVAKIQPTLKKKHLELWLHISCGYEQHTLLRCYILDRCSFIIQKKSPSYWVNS